MTASVSVVIPTRDRPHLIGQAVESVASCRYPSFDLHVMDQSTTDATERVVREIAARFVGHCEITYHHLNPPGTSRAYNEAFRTTDGALIACTDDDVIVPSDWLTNIDRSFDGDDKAGLLYGQVLAPEGLATDNTVIPSLMWARRERLYYEDRNFRMWGMGANMALRRDLLNDVDGFDEMMGLGAPLRSANDFDFAFRTYRAKRAILLEPSVTVDHYGARDNDQWPATLKTYGFGDGSLYAKHIRCGDPLALQMLFGRLSHSFGQAAKESVRQRRFVNLGPYGRSLFSGVRESFRFAVDRQTRLYRETARSRMATTDGNALSVGSDAT
jgi:glycosyltransferase involved in cell wall biosynthesis